jgi:hypothetical protein
MLSKKEPSSIAEMAESLAMRIKQNGAPSHVHTISAEHAPCPSCRERRTRSLRHCHLPAEPKARHPAPRDTGAYVPEMSARIDNDQNLTDGSRRCARKIAEYVYRKNRAGREAFITVPYLAKALGRCRRTVQRYLRQLEREGYIDVRVLPSERTRMCFGLLVRLLPPLFPKHRRHKWPGNVRNSGATGVSQIYNQGYLIRPMKRSLWAFLCCQGVWRGYMKTLTPFPPFPTAQVLR